MDDDVARIKIYSCALCEVVKRGQYKLYFLTYTFFSFEETQTLGPKGQVGQTPSGG